MRGLFEDNWNSLVHVAFGFAAAYLKSPGLILLFGFYQLSSIDENTPIDMMEFLVGGIAGSMTIPYLQ
jgi:hypothetical protein